MSRFLLLLSRFSLCLGDLTIWLSLVAQMVKNLPAVQETWVWSLSWEDPLENRMATHSSIIAWRIPWTEEPGGLHSMRSQGVGHNWSDLAGTHVVSYGGVVNADIQYIKRRREAVHMGRKTICLFFLSCHRTGTLFHHPSARRYMFHLCIVEKILHN